MEKGDFILYRNAERNFEVISVRTSKRWESVLEQALGAYFVFWWGGGRNTMLIAFPNSKGDP